MKRYFVWEEGEYNYPGAYGFSPDLHAYVHEDRKKRPCVLVVPGGGYRMVSPTEGEIVAKKFYEMGYQTFVFTYSTNLLDLAPLRDQPLKDLSRAVRFIRSRKDEFSVIENQLYLCGFSAGAHLCGSVAVHWQDVVENNMAYKQISNRPDGVILSYPVITSGEYAHRDSFTALYGENADPAELEYMSLEKQVNTATPPVFLWQTVEDELVPVENSYLMAMALRKAGISYAHHVFPKGIHGLSLSDKAWESGDFGEPYTVEQTNRLLTAMQEGRIVVSSELKERFSFMQEFTEPKQIPQRHAIAEAGIWPELADAWLKSLE